VAQATIVVLVAVHRGVAMVEVVPVAGSRRIEAECMVMIEIDLHALAAASRSAVETDMGVLEIAPIVEVVVVVLVMVVVPRGVVADMKAGDTPAMTIALVADIALEVVVAIALATVVAAAMVVAVVDTAYIHPFKMIYINLNERMRLQYKQAVFIFT